MSICVPSPFPPLHSLPFSSLPIFFLFLSSVSLNLRTLGCHLPIASQKKDIGLHFSLFYSLSIPLAMLSKPNTCRYIFLPVFLKNRPHFLSLSPDPVIRIKIIHKLIDAGQSLSRATSRDKTTNWAPPMQGHV